MPPVTVAVAVAGAVGVDLEPVGGAFVPPKCVKIMGNVMMRINTMMPATSRGKSLLRRLGLGGIGVSGLALAGSEGGCWGQVG